MMMKPECVPGGLSRVERYDDPRIGERWHIMVGRRLIAVCDDKEIASYLVDCFNVQDRAGMSNVSDGFRRWATWMESGKAEAMAQKRKYARDFFSQRKLNDMELRRQKDIELLIEELKRRWENE